MHSKQEAENFTTMPQISECLGIKWKKNLITPIYNNNNKMALMQHQNAYYKRRSWSKLHSFVINVCSNVVTNLKYHL